MKIAIIDVETSGLDPRENEILDLACVMDGRGFHVKVKPTRMQYASERAIEINGYTPEAWEDAIPLDAALIMLNDFVGTSAVFMAYNVAFDWGFVYEAYRTCGLTNPFTYQKLCLMSIAWAQNPEKTPPTLKSLCERLGIPPEPPVHQAINGARCAAQVATVLHLLDGTVRGQVADTTKPISS